jgi:uncharacterized Zn finger protein
MWFECSEINFHWIPLCFFHFFKPGFTSLSTCKITREVEMDYRLSEDMIRERTNEQSFQRGLDYYRTDAIFNTSVQSCLDGILLTAQSEGSSSSSYKVTAVLGTDGILSTSCNCPYDWGDDCKHSVAMLLSYLNHPGTFSEKKSVNDLLSGLEKDALAKIIARLVERNPGLYDELEIAIQVASVATKAKASGLKRNNQTQISEKTYRKQVRSVLKYGHHEYRDDEGSSPYLTELEGVQRDALQLLDAGDGEGALIILQVLLEELVDDYESEADYDGDVALFIQDLGMPLAEAILSVELDEQARQALRDSLKNVIDSLDESIEESELEVISAALEYGWSDPPDEEIPPEEYDEDIWMVFDDLQQARLNVLERQGRIDEFLQLAEKEDTLRFTLKLLQLGRINDAIAASHDLVGENKILKVAQALCKVECQDDAIELAERVIKQEGSHGYELAAWLAPLEEKKKNVGVALLAYQIAFETQPSISIYRHIKHLASKRWETLRPILVKKVEEKQSTNVLADIYLEDGEWDATILIAEKSTWDLIPLEIENLREIYARRPAFQKAIKDL